MKRSTLGLVLLARSACSLAAVTVESIDLTASSAPQDVRVFSAAPSAVTLHIEVDVNHAGQVMDGIGGAFNELGWDALSALPAERRAEVMRALFDTKTGAALRFNRIPIGASDFAKSAYSLDDVTDDWALAHFSTQRDEGCLIPYIKAAQSVNPAMKFHASPWSPPGWMKTNGKQTDGGELKGDERTLQAHAAYLVKFLEAYAAQGIHVNRLCVQNEPLVGPKYPGCIVPAPLFAKVIKQYIVPAVRKSSVPTEVWAGTLDYWRADTAEYSRNVLADAELARVIGGVGFQYSHLPWVREYHARYPDVPIMFTESQCYNGDNTTAQALRDFQDFAAYTRTGCRLFTFWNMVLPEPRKSTWGWGQNSLVVINKEKQSVTYQPTFALARFLGRHVTPGTRYLPATVTGIGPLDFPTVAGFEFLQSKLDSGQQVVAFRQPDGSLAVLLWNDGPAVAAQVSAGTQQATVQLPAKSLSAVLLGWE